MSARLYPYNLGNFLVTSNDSFIPRKIKVNEHLYPYKRYFSINYFKVEESYTILGQEYYHVRYCDKLYGQISYPLNHEYTYELTKDKKNLKEISNLINNKTSYTGAEIKYWFFINGIDLDSDQYNGFLSFLDPHSKSMLSDDKRYFVSGVLENGVYKDCRCALDKRYNKRKKK